MGNLSFLVPTKREGEFTLDNVLAIIKPKFSKLKIFKIEGFEQLRVENFKGELLCELWIDRCSVLDDLDDDIESGYYKGDELKLFIELKESNLDVNNCIQVSYGYTLDLKKNRSKVLKEICKEFGCYWFDEGIHPEYMKF